MLKKMMEEFEKRQGFPVHSDMDIQTEVAWEKWKAAHGTPEQFELEAT